MYSCTLPLTSALDGLGGQLHPRPLYSLERPGTRCIGGGWPQSRSGRVRKISPPPGFDPRIVQPVSIRNTDWAIPAHSMEMDTGENSNSGSRKWTQYPLNRRLGGSQSRSGRCGQNKISRPHRDSNPCRPAPDLVAIPTTLFPDPEKNKAFWKSGEICWKVYTNFSLSGHTVNSGNRTILAFTYWSLKHTEKKVNIIHTKETRWRL
jgi:hypothetical protein